MIKERGNSIYIRNVQVPNKLEIQVTCAMQNGRKINGVNSFCNPHAVLGLNLDPRPFIGKNSSIYDDMNDYILHILNQFIKKCYFDITTPEGYKTYKGLKDYFSNNEPKENDDIYTRLCTQLRTALEDKNVLQILLNDSIFEEVFSIVIGAVDIDFEDDYMSELFNSEFDIFSALFYYPSLRGKVSYNMSGNKNKYTFDGGTLKTYKLSSLYFMLAEIFFFYAFQDRRNQLAAGKILDLLTYRSSFKSRGEIYVWDNNLEEYMSYCPKKENKFLIGDICQSITVPHTMTEGYSNLPEELKSNGGEKFNPIERKKIFLARQLASNGGDYKTFITMPNRRFGQYNGINTINSYIAYRSYQNSNQISDAVGIDLYTEHKDSVKSQTINRVIYAPHIKSTVLSHADELKYIDYANLYFNSIQYDLNNPDIEFKCNVAYFTKGGGRTFKTNDELKTTKIPKEKRDEVFAALCDLCYEIDVDPQEVLNRLDVDFKRYYKKPNELL